MEKIEEMVNYCLNCKVKPCSVKGCPLNNNIPNFINAVKEQNIEEAYKIISETTVLPGVCGRICPHQKQCEGSCIRGIKGQPVSIGEIEAFVFDRAVEMGNTLKKVPNLQNKKVAVIGGGPAGLTCAGFLAKNGVDVTIYERYSYLGGLLMYGIPDFRLPKEIVSKTVKQILDLGVKVKYNKVLGENLNIKDLENEYDAIFLGIGANRSCKLNIQGEELQGVYGGNELLEHEKNKKYDGKTVSIIGGGNVAIDCARTIKRKGAKKVLVIYRRAKEQMPAEQKEVEDAIAEGIDFLFQNNIVKIIGDKKVEKIELIKTELVKKDNEDRLVPVNITGSNYEIDTDYLVTALGSQTEKYVERLGVELTENGNIKVNESLQTSRKKVYAGGDVAGMKGTVAWAASSGRKAANSICEKFKEVYSYKLTE